MATKPVAWAISDGGVQRLETVTPEYEKDLENGIEQDPDIIDSDLLLIARQCTITHNTFPDLLGVNGAGDLVIIELKREKTLRETVAQGLEYAAWASRLSADDIIALAAKYKKLGSEHALKDAFKRRFGAELPDVLNQSQKIILVAPEITDATAHVIEYLAQTYAVPINAVSFGLVRGSDSRPILMRALVLDEEEPRRPVSTKRVAATIPELLEQAEQHGVGDVARYSWSLQPSFLVSHYQKGWEFARRTPVGRRGIIVVYPIGTCGASRVVVSMKPQNLAGAFGKTLAEAQQFIQLARTIGEDAPSGQVWQRVAFRDVAKARAFVQALAEFAGEPLEAGEDAHE